MKTLILALVMVAVMAGNVRAEWSKADTALEVSYQVLAGMDWVQTRYIQSHPIRKSEVIVANTQDV